MKFSLLVSIVSEELEENTLFTAKNAGAGGVTILKGKGVGGEEKKTFFGLTYEGAQSVLIFVLEKKLSLKVLKALSQEKTLKGNCVTFTIPLEHLSGINIEQLMKFENELKQEI